MQFSKCFKQFIMRRKIIYSSSSSPIAISTRFHTSCGSSSSEVSLSLSSYVATIAFFFALLRRGHFDFMCLGFLHSKYIIASFFFFRLLKFLNLLCSLDFLRIFLHFLAIIAIPSSSITLSLSLSDLEAFKVNTLLLFNFITSFNC